MYQMTPWVTRLLVANIAIYFALDGLGGLGNADLGEEIGCKVIIIIP